MVRPQAAAFFLFLKKQKQSVAQLTIVTLGGFHSAVDLNTHPLNQSDSA